MTSRPPGHGPASHACPFSGWEERPVLHCSCFPLTPSKRPLPQTMQHDFSENVFSQNKSQEGEGCLLGAWQQQPAAGVHPATQRPPGTEVAGAGPPPRPGAVSAAGRAERMTTSTTTCLPDDGFTRLTRLRVHHSSLSCVKAGVLCLLGSLWS